MRFWTRRGHLRAPATATELLLWARRRDTRLRLGLRPEARAIAPHPMIAAHSCKLGAIGIALWTHGARRIRLTLRPRREADGGGASLRLANCAVRPHARTLLLAGSDDRLATRVIGLQRDDIRGPIARLYPLAIVE